MDKSEFRAHTYKIVDKYEDLEHKTIKAVFNISGTKKVFVTDACVLVTVSGVEMAGNAVHTTSGILEEIESVTGIRKDQYVNNFKGTLK